MFRVPAAYSGAIERKDEVPQGLGNICTKGVTASAMDTALFHPATKTQGWNMRKCS